MRTLVVVAAAICLSCAAHAQFLPSLLPALPSSCKPHPAVVRIVCPEVDGTAYGSGTLIDVREDYGLVLTNWHVVRDANGPIEVRFPGGFTSQARALKMDSEWDLAALVVWRPPVEPVTLAAGPPRPGDLLTIAGYGKGDYRAITGRCTQFYSPRLELPRELVELNVEARQGDSGGPIFNDRGELAGVLFGAGQGTTLGSFEGRVKTFLASLAPDIGNTDGAPQVALAPNPHSNSRIAEGNSPTGATTCSPRCPTQDLGDVCFGCENVAKHHTQPTAQHPISQPAPADDWPALKPAAGEPVVGWEAARPDPTSSSNSEWPSFASDTATETTNSQPIVPAGVIAQLKNLLAIVGGIAIVLQVVRLAG